MVAEAYADQFEEDMELFLRARGEEIVKGGMVIIIMPGVADGVLTHDVGIAITFLGCILMDMVKEVIDTLTQFLNLRGYIYIGSVNVARTIFIVRTWEMNML